MAVIDTLKTPQDVELYPRTKAQAVYMADGGTVEAELTDAIGELPVDMLDTHISRTHNGVTFDWDETKNAYHITGASTGTSITNMVNTFLGISDLFPGTIKPGEKYWLDVSLDVQAKVSVRIWCNDKASTEDPDVLLSFSSSGTFSIPANATGLIIRVETSYRSSMDGYLYVRLSDKGYPISRLSEIADGYLASSNDTTERTTEILQRLTAYGKCTLGAGVYYVNALDMPDDSTLCGQGAATKIVMIGSDSYMGTAIILHARCTIRDLTVAGNLEDHTDPSIVYPASLEYVYRNGIAYVGSRGYTPQRAIISNVNVCNFTGNGIYCNNTSGTVPSGLSIINCSVWYCYNGLNIHHVSEFHKVANCNFTGCHHGVINNGGNNMFSNCVFAKDIVGMFFDNSDGQAENNGHGSVTNCTFVHADGNTGIGIKMIGITPGQIFSSCTVGYSQVYLENCNGVTFTGMNFLWGPGQAGETITVIGGTLIKFSDCVFRRVPIINITDNDTVIFDRCRDYNGVEFDQHGTIVDPTPQINARLVSLETSVNRYNAHDMLLSFGSFAGRTHNGVTFGWNDEHTVCTVNGTGSTTAWVNIYSNTRALPAGMVAGRTYRVKAKTTNTSTFLAIQAFYNNSDSGAQSLIPYREDGTYTVPANATGLNIRVHAYGGVALEDAQVYDIGIVEDLTNAELGDLIADTETHLMRGVSWSGGFDFLGYSADYVDRTHNGITFAWSADHRSCTASGTATSSVPRTNIYNSWTALPKGLSAGQTYNITAKTTDQNLYLYVAVYKNNSNAATYNAEGFKRDGTYTIPADATGLLVSVVTYINATVDGTISRIGIWDGVGNDVIAERVDALEDALEAQADVIAEDKTFGLDFAAAYGTFEDSTESGLTVHWDADHTLWLDGTTTARVDIPVLQGALPPGMNAGDRFVIYFETDYPGSLGISLKMYNASDAQVLSKLSYDGTNFPFVVPAGAASIDFGFYVLSGRTVSNYPIRALKIVKLTPRRLDYPLIVSFVDDDVSNDNLVTMFHDACCHNGVKGNYAVITEHLNDGRTTADKLLGYEDEGFGMCIHCHKQSNAPEWNVGNPRSDADSNACRANLAKGMRDMREYGFVNFEYWITPGGHREKDLRAIAQQLGCKCMIPTNNYRANSPLDIDRWMIRRVSLQGNDSWDAGSMTFVKRMINETVADGAGWLIITTHFNDPSWDGETWDTTLDANGYPVGYARVNEAFQYALSAGMVPMTIPQAWEYYGPLMQANRAECDRANARAQ